MLKQLFRNGIGFLLLFWTWGGIVQAQIVLPAANNIKTVAGNGTQGSSGDGSAATSAEFYNPGSVAVDSSGNVYIADTYNNRVRKVNASTGTITTIAGNGTAGDTGDGGLAVNAELTSPAGIALDHDNNLYIPSHYCIRKVSLSSGLISTFAGTCAYGNSGTNQSGLATAAQFSSPTAVVSDSSNNIFIADKGVNCLYKVDNSTQTISLYAGSAVASGCTAGHTGDGGLATNALISGPTSLAIDSSNNIFFSSYSTSCSCISYVRKIDSSGIISTLAGTGVSNYSGDGGLATSAQVYRPDGVAVDTSGNIYIATAGDSRVRVISSSGVISTVAGTGVASFSGDGGLAKNATLNIPGGVAVDTSGNVYIADTLDQRIRAITMALPTTTTVTTSDSSLYYGATVTFTADVSASSGTPTGTVTFYSDGTSIGTATLSSGSGSITNNTLAIGTHSITASYAQNGSYLASTSAAISQTITMVPTSINGVSVSPNPAVVTNAVTVSAYVAASNGQTPTGTMTVQVDGNTIGTPTLSSGAGSASISSLAVGLHSLGISYGGNATFDNSSVYYANYITINQITTSISVTPSTSSASFGTCVNFTANVTATQGTPTGTVAFTANSTSLGSAALGGGVAAVSNCGLPVGTYTITASYGGATNFKPISGTTSFTVTKEPTSLSWNPPAAITYGTALSGVQLNATVVNGVPGTLIYTPAAGTVLDAGLRTLSVTFTPTDTANYVGSSASVSLQVNKATPTITWASPAPIIAGAALSGTQLNASASVGGTFAYSPAAGTVLSAGLHTLSVTFTPTNTTDYNSANASVTMMVKAVPTITWPTPAPITYGTALSGTQLDASASVAGTFVYTPGPGAVLTVGTQLLSVTFTPTDGTDYSTATASVSLTVSPATPTVQWPTPAAITYGTALSSLQLDATTAGNISGTFVYTPAAGAVLPAGSQLLSVVFHPADTSDYTTATGTTILAINKAAAGVAITSSLSQSIYGDKVTESFTVSPIGGGVTPTGTITLMDGTTELTILTLTNGSASYTTSTLTAGAHTLTADYNGDEDYQ